MVIYTSTNITLSHSAVYHSHGGPKYTNFTDNSTVDFSVIGFLKTTVYCLKIAKIVKNRKHFFGVKIQNRLVIFN